MAKHHNPLELVGDSVGEGDGGGDEGDGRMLAEVSTEAEGYVCRLVLVRGIFGRELKPSRTPVRVAGVAGYKLDVAKSSVSRPVDRRRS